MNISHFCMVWILFCDTAEQEIHRRGREAGWESIHFSVSSYKDTNATHGVGVVHPHYLSISQRSAS